MGNDQKEMWPVVADPQPQLDLKTFCRTIWEQGDLLYRDLPWRHTRDPYGIWVSEVMLQQTQVSRVDGRWQRWLERFPTVEALAAAPQAEVLAEWQGMGYNRRALSLLRAAQAIRDMGTFPQDVAALTALPGIGPATAAGIRAFAFDLPGVYLETNVRAVFLHELFPHEEGVPDRALAPLVEASCPATNARGWYYALLDYGAWLKRTIPNPSRRSRTHVRQSNFEGSHRQKRAQVVRLLLAAGSAGTSADAVAAELSREELRANRSVVTSADARALLDELAAEGFCYSNNDRWFA